MNANFGIVLRRSERQACFKELPPETRTWGDEEVLVGERQFIVEGLEGVRFQLYEVTDFIKGHLPTHFAESELEYAWMTGDGLDEYERWVGETTQESAVHSFEGGLLNLITKLRTCSILFAPSGDRLEEFLSLDFEMLVDMLRNAIRFIASSRGFLATIITEGPLRR